MIGLQDGSKLTEIYVKQDENTATKYTVKQEIIDIKALEAEKASLEVVETPPSDEELIEMGKSFHPYYSETTTDKEARIAVIDSILEKAK